jgi:hypothetical protein
MKCVYRLSIGNKFYIGRTRQLDQRVKSHVSSIQNAMNNYDLLSLYHRGGESTDLRRLHYHTYRHFAKYLLENPKIDTVYVEVLFYSPYHKEISIIENKQLRYHENHPDCLNNTFRAGIDKKRFHEYGVKKVGRFLYYYELDNPNELIPCTYNLQNTGSYNKPRKKKS